MTPGGQMFIEKDNRKKSATPAGVVQRCFQLFSYKHEIPAYRQAGLRDLNTYVGGA